MSTQEEILWPFGSLNDLTRAIFIINKSYSKQLANILVITECINSINKSRLDVTDVNRFIDKMALCPELYHQEALAQITSLDNQVNEFMTKRSLPTTVIRPRIMNCNHCKATSTKHISWFTSEFSQRVVIAYYTNKTSN